MTHRLIYFVAMLNIGEKENMTTYQKTLLTYMVGIIYATRKL